MAGLCHGKTGNDKTPEIEQCSEQVYQDVERLTQLLDEDGKRSLERLMDNRSELESRQILEGFKDGFRLGVQLTASGLRSKNKLYKTHKFCPESLCNI